MVLLNWVASGVGANDQFHGTSLDLKNQSSIRKMFIILVETMWLITTGTGDYDLILTNLPFQLRCERVESESEASCRCWWFEIMAIRQNFERSLIVFFSLYFSQGWKFSGTYFISL